MKFRKNKIHTFENGVKVFDHQLLKIQKDRYSIRNVHEFEEEDIFIKIVKSIKSNGTFVNVGSAIGYYAILAKKISPNLKIHLYEPLSDHIKHFKNNLKLNNMDINEFNIHQVGLYIKNGSTQMINQGFSSVINRDNRNLQIKKYMKFRNLLHFLNINNVKKLSTIITIDFNFLLKQVGEYVDFLQMDIQGLEAMVLASAEKTIKNKPVGIFLVGTHGLKIHALCIQIFKRCGYNIEIDISKPKEQPDGIIVANRWE